MNARSIFGVLLVTSFLGVAEAVDQFQVGTWAGRGFGLGLTFWLVGMWLFVLQDIAESAKDSA